ncbi:MAG: 3-phosphoshikimate 1-carboxyvinyltransferase [Armatimonadetes bacterium]|nr:3-phosphoshikimate 1-carboxyvinyltransferase [Armatimonadota bacterium]
MLPDVLAIETVSRVDACVEIPGSKSYTNRALVMAALAEGASRLTHALRSDDTLYMADGLRAFGAVIEEEEETLIVRGTGGRLQTPSRPVFIGNAGTAMRFLTALAGLAEGASELTGVPRMRQRPIQDLLGGLQLLGIRAISRQGNGCPPVVVEGGIFRGGFTRMPGDRSSQYFTAILLAAPYAREDVTVEVIGDLTSRPYLEMTIEGMRSFGVQVENDRFRAFHVRAGQRYRAGEHAVEADASNASYFLAAAAVTGGRVRVLHINPASAQGDIRFADVLARMGCRVVKGPDWIEVEGGSLQGVDIDLNDMPDMAQTLAVAAAFASSPTRIRNVGNLRIKETDRVASTAAELQKIGAGAEEFEDGLLVTPRPLHGADIATYDDHRMAMSFAVAGLKVPGIRILNPGCVSKTFPDFFDRWRQLYP